MERLDSFDFDARPDRSRYAAVAKALVDDKVHAVKLKRGVDFPADVKMTTVQSGVRNVVSKAGKRARTYIVSEDEIVVGLNTDQSPRKRGRRRELATA